MKALKRPATIATLSPRAPSPPSTTRAPLFLVPSDKAVLPQFVHGQPARSARPALRGEPPAQQRLHVLPDQVHLEVHLGAGGLVGERGHHPRVRDQRDLEAAPL